MRHDRVAIVGAAESPSTVTDVARRTETFLAEAMVLALEDARIYRDELDA